MMSPASYFLPNFNGIYHSNIDPFAKSSIAKMDSPPHSGDSSQCSNVSGRKIRCKRIALPNRKRCRLCTRSNFESLKRNFLTRMVVHSKKCDTLKGYKWKRGTYVTRAWLNHQFRKTGATCYWCGFTNLDCRTRTGANGFTLERLSNNLPHLKRNCVFACGLHNRRSWRSGFTDFPFHLRKITTCVDRQTILKQERVCLEILSTRFGSRVS